MIKNIFSEYLKSHEGRRKDQQALSNVARDYSNNYTSDWRWFSIKCERIIENEMQKKSLREEDRKRKPYSTWVKEAYNLSTFRSFFPKTLLKVYSRCDDPNKFFSKLVIQKFDAVVFFCDASGFSNLAEQLDKRINGTELLGNCLNKFFNILIKIIDCWGGDIIKFSGDAVLVIWPLRRGHRGEAEKKSTGSVTGSVAAHMEESIDGVKQAERAKTGRTAKTAKPTASPATSNPSGEGTHPQDNSDYYPSDTTTPNGETIDGEKRKNQKEKNVKKICLLALGCCVDIHKLLNKFPTPIENKYLKVHIAITYGKVSFLQLGNILNKRDYLLSGKPLEEIGIAESLARNGESVISQRFYEKVKDKILVKETPKKKFLLFVKMKEEIDMRQMKREYEQEDEWDVPSGELSRGLSRELSREEPREESTKQPREASRKKSTEHPSEVLNTLTTRRQSRYDPDETPLAHEHFCFLLKSFIPDIVYRKMSIGCNIFLNEIRKVTIIFLSVKDIDTSTMIGVYSAHGIMKLTQKAVFTMEGTINKFIYDDKGILILIMFGLPPLYHCDDSVRALLTCFRLIDALKSLKLNGSIGISTGRIWCGIIGNKIRKEYTALGDSVNVAARLCCKAGNKEIYVDENTFNGCKHFISFQKLISIKVKGKNKLIKIYSPIGTINRGSPQLGLEEGAAHGYFTDEELQGVAHGYFTDEELQAVAEELSEEGEPQKGSDKRTQRGSGSGTDKCTQRERSLGAGREDEVGSRGGARDERNGHIAEDGTDATQPPDLNEVIDFSFLNRNYLLRYYERTLRRRIKRLLGKKDCLYYLRQCEEGAGATWKERCQPDTQAAYQGDTQTAYRGDPYGQIKTTTPLDYNTHTGPLLLHEYYDPLYCDFTQMYNTGGVLFLQGNEHLGIFEIITLISRKLSNFKSFKISNMPNSLYINVTNPLLPWKMLCNDMLHLWGACQMRKQNTLIRNGDNYNLLREITHPSYHWFFKCMSSVVDDLVIPYWGHSNGKGEKQKEKQKTGARSNQTGAVLLSTHQPTDKDTDRTRRKKKKSNMCSLILTAIDHLFSSSTQETGRRPGPFPSLGLAAPREASHRAGNKAETKTLPQTVPKWAGQTASQSVAQIAAEAIPPGSYRCAEAYPLFKANAKDNRMGIISSMVYYFSLHEYTFIVFNYRAGTSLNVMRDESAWQICKNIAKLAMYKRGKILDSIQREVKHWRRNHCRGCNYCKGVPHVGSSHPFAGNDDHSLATPSESYDFGQRNHSSASTHTRSGQPSHEEENKALSSRNSEEETGSHGQRHSHLSSDCRGRAYEAITPSGGETERHVNKSGNLGDINIAQMFREERDKQPQGLNRRFYKTLIPNINDDILLYVAEQKMREQPEGRGRHILGHAGASQMDYAPNGGVPYDTTRVEKHLTSRTVYSMQENKSPLCDPIFKGKHKPLIFLFVNGMKNDDIKIRAIRKIKKYAQQCNGYLKLEELSRERLFDFVSLCLHVKKDELNEELIDYLHKTCFGIPKFVQYTLFYLLTKKYIKLYRCAYPVKSSDPVGEAPNQRDTSIGGSGTDQHSPISGFASNPGKGPMHKEGFYSVGSTTDAGSTSAHDPTSYTYINEATKQIIRHQNGFRNFQFCDDSGSDANGSHANGSHANGSHANGSHANGSHANGSDANDSQEGQLGVNRDASLRGPPSKEKDNPTGTHQKGYKYRITVVRDLNSAPLVPRLTAHCMSLIDSLNQEELLLAKLCSFFKQKFNIKKMKCIFPRYISLSELKRIIRDLIKKSVFQLCEENRANQVPTDDVNSIHNINFVYRDIYNLINDITTRRHKHHSLFSRNSAISDEESFFCIVNFSLKKVLNDLLENEEKKYIQKIYKKYLDE
ncbi:hypothetical protein C922_02886 [Plasmodium inui San Antonio 1]|uniref:Guanylate cyclase domain-containing protein n=1 Tax=Plasmodium inui San Antonio 1 TaxID=1237626 RepID=W7A4F4_9APIC|nr:hypothetical protein C922_02886 [Plasmodium inui San Antonio 1]EUD66565.1 hypothetical protein C922_02886 [Plasmodium inui San Antonio 1]